MRGGLIVACLAASLASAPPPPAETRRPPELQALVREAETVDPEFSADILIRAAQAAGATDPRWERELLDEAFVRAYAAQQPYRRSAPPLPPDTRQHAEALAADTPIDTASLQLRVVQVMRLLDPAHARELFEWISLPLEEGGCESALVPAVDEYYAALAALARDTFPKTAMGRADALRFLELYLWRARLPSEMPAVARTIERLPRTFEEAAYFESLFRVLLVTSTNDARGFSTSGIDVVARVGELERADTRLGILGSHLSDALRRLMINQLRAGRCRDSAAEGSIVDAFNAMLLRNGAILDGIQPLTPADTWPARMLGALRIDRLWQTADARRLLEDATDLHGPGDKPISMKIRLTPEWQLAAEHHLAEVDLWTGVREPAERDYFFEKGVLYIGLVDLVPHGALRTHVLQSFAEFLHHADAEHQRQLWFAIANRLIELTRSDDSPQVIPMLEHSGNPALALYAHAARVLAVRRSAGPPRLEAATLTASQ